VNGASALSLVQRYGGGARFLRVYILAAPYGRRENCQNQTSGSALAQQARPVSLAQTLPFLPGALAISLRFCCAAALLRLYILRNWRFNAGMHFSGDAAFCCWRLLRRKRTRKA